MAKQLVDLQLEVNEIIQELSGICKVLFYQNVSPLKKNIIINNTPPSSPMVGKSKWHLYAQAP